MPESRSPMSFLGLLRHEPRPIAFGLLYSCGSSVGQTYIIALFVPGISESFGFGPAGIANLYAAVTVASAFALGWAGRWIDRFDLLLYGLGTVLFLAAGCALMALAEGLPLLALGLFAVRCGGQGLMSHVAMTGIARHFDALRGRALAVTSLGYPLGEAVFPATTLLLIQALGWRGGYAVWAAGLVAVVLPLAVLLMRGQARFRTPAARPVPRDGEPKRASELGRLLRSRYFLLMTPILAAAPMLGTGLIFHQARIAETKGIGLAWFAAGFTVYAAMQVASSLLSGPVIDRIGARRLFPWHLAPFAAGVLLLALVDGSWAAPAYLGMAGLTGGLGLTTRTAIVAELVSAAELGAARSAFTALTVGATALGPAFYGALMEAGISLDAMLALTVAGLLGATVLAVLAERRRPAPGAG